MIKQIGLPLRGRPILLITRMITDRIGLHSVLLPLLIISLLLLLLGGSHYVNTVEIGFNSLFLLLTFTLSCIYQFVWNMLINVMMMIVVLV